MFVHPKELKHSRRDEPMSNDLPFCRLSNNQYSLCCFVKLKIPRDQLAGSAIIVRFIHTASIFLTDASLNALTYSLWQGNEYDLMILRELFNL